MTYKLFGYAPKNAMPGMYAGFVAAANKMAGQAKAEKAFNKPYLAVLLTEIPLPGFKLVKDDENGENGADEQANG